MNSLWIYVYFCLIVLALLIIYYSLRPKASSFCILSIVFSVSLIGCYWCWGGWQALHTFYKQSQSDHPSEMLVSADNIDALISELKDHLIHSPNSAKGWYFLGKLFINKEQWLQAHDALDKARQLDPKNEEIIIHYALSECQITHCQLSVETRQLLHQILKKNIIHPNILSILAMDAYQRKKYQQAIHYWLKLLTVTPKDAEIQLETRRAIADAKDKLNMLRKDSTSGK